MDFETQQEHPKPQALAAFLRAELTPAEGRAVIAHLLRGCETCSQWLQPALSGLFRPSLSVVPFPFDEGAYDGPIDRALARTYEAIGHSLPDLGEEEEIPTILFAALPRLQERCEVLLAESWELRTSDPAAMVRRARLAAQLSDSLGAADGSPSERADFQAKAWGELGNALRIAGDLRGASAAFDRALERLERGSGDPSLFARLLDRAASLAIHERRFTDACGLLDSVFEAYRRSGETHLAGRALISKANALAFDNDFEGARGLIAQGLARLDARLEPRVVLSGIHSLILFAAEGEAFAEARGLIDEARGLYEQCGGPTDLIKLRWIEGRIEAGLGHAEAAEITFWEVRDEFEGRGLVYESAIVALDLAMLWLPQRRSAEILELVEEMLETFRALGIRREAIAALLVLRRALDRDRATNELVRSVAGRLKRLESFSI